jgi:ribosome-associated protein
LDADAQTHIILYDVTSYDASSASSPAPGAAIEIAPGVFVQADGLRIQFSRAGGPGGQNVNKLNTKAELWVQLGGLVGLTDRALARLRTLAGNRLTQNDEIHIRAENSRSQEANREEVFDRLRQLVLTARVEPKPRRKTRPSRAAKQRRLESKRRRGQVKSQRRGRGDADEW